MSLHRRVAAPVMALSLIAAGCGGGTGPAPRTWAASVCSALSPWRAKIDALDTADATVFNRSVAAAFAKLNQEYAGSALDTSNVGSVDLQKAFAEVPECR